MTPPQQPSPRPGGGAFAPSGPVFVACLLGGAAAILALAGAGRPGVVGILAILGLGYATALRWARWPAHRPDPADTPEARVGDADG